MCCCTFPRECSQQREWQRECQLLCVMSLPQELVWLQGGTALKSFPLYPLFLVKTKLELYKFITVFSCNSYNSQAPVDPFSSWHAACSGPHADPKRAQAVSLTRALLMITNLAISSLPSTPSKTNPLVWICSTLTHPSCQSLPSFLLFQMCRKQASEQKKRPFINKACQLWVLWLHFPAL